MGRSITLEGPRVLQPSTALSTPGTHCLGVGGLFSVTLLTAAAVFSEHQQCPCCCCCFSTLVYSMPGVSCVGFYYRPNIAYDRGLVLNSPICCPDPDLLCRYWSELHVPGTPAPFKLRGASYLADRTKVDGGMPQFVLGSVDLVETAGPTQHISRFLPAVR